MHELQPPFPAAVNPREPEIARHLATRAREISIADRELAAEVRKARLERVISRMYPTAGPRALLSVADLVVWTVLIDDYLDPHRPDQPPSHVDRVQASIEAVLAGHGATNHHGLLDGWLASALRSLEGPDDAWRSQLVEHLREYTASLCTEARAHASGDMPSITEYLLRRRDTGAWPALVDLVELQPGAALPNDCRRAEATKRMWTHAGEAFCAINDILSLSRELARGEYHNLVLLIQHHDACTLPNAVDRVRAYIADRTNEYLKSKTIFFDHMTRLGPQMCSTGERYTVGLEHLLRGSYDWSVDTGRYAPHADTDPATTQPGP